MNLLDINDGNPGFGTRIFGTWFMTKAETFEIEHNAEKGLRPDFTKTG